MSITIPLQESPDYDERDPLGLGRQGGRADQVVDDSDDDEFSDEFEEALRSELIRMGLIDD